MGNNDGNATGVGGTEENGGGDRRPMRPVPPPEAFRHLEGFREQSQNGKETNSDEDTSNRPDAINSSELAARAAAAATTAAPQRRLTRRPSSMFGELVVQKKSRLFDDLIPSSSRTETKLNNNNNNDNNNKYVVAETNMATNFSGSQSTWLQDDHQSTLMAADSRFTDTRSQFPADSQSEPTTTAEKSSLFGAVMRQFGSSISSAIPPSSPFRRRATTNDDNSLQPNTVGFRNLMASPSGKTIMNIVNQFNSPFKFQSPSSSHKKRQRRRRLWNDDDNDDSAVSKKRQRLDQEDDESKQSSNVLFPETNDSRSSLGGGLVDEHWREAPIVERNEEQPNVQMEVLDWSLVTKVRIEAHGGTIKPHEPHWILDAMHDHRDAFGYWIHQPLITNDESTPTNLPSGLLSRRNSASNLSTSKGLGKSFLSRQGSFGSRLDAKLAGKTKNSSSSNNNNNNKKGDQGEAPNPAKQQLAKDLMQLVRGPNAKYSRKRVLQEHFWWEEEPTTTIHNNNNKDAIETSRRQWQDSLRSLYFNYRRRVLNENHSRDSIKSMVLDTYFYAIGRDHSVLFRVAMGNDIDNAVPIVLVSSTSESFRKKLESHGMNLSRKCDDNDDDKEVIQLLESIQERESREKRKLIEAAAEAARKSKRIFQNVTQDVKADLEALRRAQAFGETAGADVNVRVKKKDEDAADEDGGKEKETLPKGIEISGWDNVSLFVEVYSNLYGDAMGEDANTGATTFRDPKSSHKILPLLVCPNTADFGAFEHATLKRLSLFPGEQTPNSKEKNHAQDTSTNAMEIRGIVLPCALRTILLVARNRILQDEKRFSVSTNSRKKNDDSDSSRYVVLHSSRPTILNSHKELPKSWIGGLNGSLIFNQGKKMKQPKELDENGNKSTEDQVFECSYGSVVSMAVWDTSREEVAACKLDSAFPENWIHKK